MTTIRFYHILPSFEEGKQAYLDGDEIEDCLYGEDTDNEAAWVLGWKAAAKEKTMSDAHLYKCKRAGNSKPDGKCSDLDSSGTTMWRAKEKCPLCGDERAESTRRVYCHTCDAWWWSPPKRK